MGFEPVFLHSATADVIIIGQTTYHYATQLDGLRGFQFSCISGRIVDGFGFFSRIDKF